MTKKDYKLQCRFCGKIPIRISGTKPAKCLTCGKLQKEVLK